MLTQHMVHSLLHPSGTDQSAYMSLVPTAELTEIVECPKSMVGRVIGKGGETIKALQQYTKAMIQIDQSQDPTRVAIAGERSAVLLARCMVKVCGNRNPSPWGALKCLSPPCRDLRLSAGLSSQMLVCDGCAVSNFVEFLSAAREVSVCTVLFQDIVDGNFKGFAMLRQLTQAHNEKALGGLEYPQRGQPFYVEVTSSACGTCLEAVCLCLVLLLICGNGADRLLVCCLQGYGFVPPSQVCVLPGRQPIGSALKYKIVPCVS